MMKTCLIQGEITPSCHGLNSSAFGLVLASLWGESLGTLGTLLLSFKTDFLCVNLKNNKLLVLDSVSKLSKTIGKYDFFTCRDPAELTQ
jgi:hypothetical protein